MGLIPPSPPSRKSYPLDVPPLLDDPEKYTLAMMMGLELLENGYRLPTISPYWGEYWGEDNYEVIFTKGLAGGLVSKTTLPMTHSEYYALISLQRAMPERVYVTMWGRKILFDENFIIADLSNGDRLVMTKKDYEDIMAYNEKQKADMNKDTLFIDEYGGSVITTAKDATRLQKEFEERQKNKDVELVKYKNGDEAYVPKSHVQALKDNNKLWTEEDTKHQAESNPKESTYMSTSKEIARQKPNFIDEVLQCELESLDATGLLERYILDQQEIERLYDIDNDVDKNLSELVEPEIIEDLYTYRQQKLERDAIKQMAEDTKEDNLKTRLKLRDKRDFVAHLALESEDIPKKKWIKVFDEGIYISTLGSNPCICTKSWDKVLEEKQQDEVSNISRGLVEAVGIGSFIGLSITACGVAVWLINPLAGLLTACVAVIILFELTQV